jgi:hypothetical protein
MIGELADVTRATLVGPVRVERAMAIAGSVDGDQSHLLPNGSVGDGFEVAV